MLVMMLVVVLIGMFVSMLIVMLIVMLVAMLVMMLIVMLVSMLVVMLVAMLVVMLVAMLVVMLIAMLVVMLVVMLLPAQLHGKRKHGGSVGGGDGALPAPHGVRGSMLVGFYFNFSFFNKESVFRVVADSICWAALAECLQRPAMK